MHNRFVIRTVNTNKMSASLGIKGISRVIFLQEKILPKVSVAKVHSSCCLEAYRQQSSPRKYRTQDRTKDKEIMQHFHHKDREKSLKHRNSLLVQLPDYTYLDGRSTELNKGQRSRQEKNYQMAKDVMRMVQEMTFAKQEYQDKQESNKKAIQARLNSRLKPKTDVE